MISPTSFGKNGTVIFFGVPSIVERDSVFLIEGLDCFEIVSVDPTISFSRLPGRSMWIWISALQNVLAISGCHKRKDAL